MKQYIVDAFTSELFSGNPAAVLPCRQMPPAELMQKIAIENNYSETAFVVRKAAGRYDLKWFTPGGEVALCGHATLATSFVLYHFVDPGVAEMYFDTLSGELIVKASDDGFTMDFPVGSFKPVPLTPEILAATGGLASEAFYDAGDDGQNASHAAGDDGQESSHAAGDDGQKTYHAAGDNDQEASHAAGDMVVVVPSEEALAHFVPDFDLMKRLPGRGLVLTAPASQRRDMTIPSDHRDDLTALSDNACKMIATGGHYCEMITTDEQGSASFIQGQSPAESYDFVSRCFYPKLDVPEDPVTGSAHTYLTPLWASRLGLLTPCDSPSGSPSCPPSGSPSCPPSGSPSCPPSGSPFGAAASSREMRARQISRRGGDLKVRLAAGRVLITGAACLFMSGDIPFDL